MMQTPALISEKKMPVVLKHKCGALLELTLEMAGKSGTCPSCGGAIAVPWHDKLRELMQEARAAHLHHESAEKDAETSPPKPPVAPAAKEDEFANVHFAGLDEPTTRPEHKHCPECNHVLSDDAVICVNCGTNVKTGHKIDTSIVTPKTPPPKDKPQSKKP